MEKWLDQIQSPENLKGLTVSQLEEVAREMRDIITRTVAANSGHLASSLGVVELTLALHSVYDSPRDKIIWDVGHQAYGHKLLTGRAPIFSRLRCEDGLSGFPRRDESPHDAFGTGHASTSISAALGMAIARDRNGEEYHVISVTGDGAMTGGLCYEGLNNVGSLGADLLIVLNDNEMSISENRGAIARYFNRLVTTVFYNEAKKDIKGFLRRFPTISKRVEPLARRVEESVKGLIVPGILFEELGIRYLGPVDGHSLEALIYTLRKVRELKGPILLHVITQKGRGHPYSEDDPVTYHGPPKFKAETGELVAKTSNGRVVPTYTRVFSDTLCDLARQDERIVALTAAMPTGTGLAKFSDTFPDRFFDVGIAEAHAVVCAAGMACQGLRPVVAVYSSFLQRAFDPIIHDVALQRLPVVFIVDRAGVVGEDGPTHHGVFDLSYLRMVPNLTIMAPSDASELRDMLATALAYEDGPVALRFPRGAAEGPVSTAPPRLLPVGQGEVIREGKDVMLLAIGSMTAPALAAAKILEREGIQTGLANMRFAKPLDRELVRRAAQSCPLVVTLEENTVAGGFGSAVTETIAAMGMLVNIYTLGLPDCFIEQGAAAQLRHKYGLSAESVAQTVREALIAPSTRAQKP